MTAHANPWIMTASGRAFDLIEPSAAMVHWPDVAEQLAKTARFAGATPGVFYSVAQHSVLVASLVEPTWKPWALLHDAHEAFLGDDTTPKKAALAMICRMSAEIEIGHATIDLREELSAVLGDNSRAWRAIDPILQRRAHVPSLGDAMRRALDAMRARIDGAVWAAAGLDRPCDACRRAVARADRVALATERRDLMPEGLDAEWDIELPAPDRRRIRALPWPKAQALFESDLYATLPALANRRRAA